MVRCRVPLWGLCNMKAGLLTSERQALAASGRIRLQPCHSLSAVGPMTGVITPSMPLMVVENRAHGNRAYCTLNEGLGKVLRFGANDASVLERLHWLQQTVAPSLHTVAAPGRP